ncbi:AP-1 complex subunit beta-1 isoform X1 [Marmota marmota marmota]|uniref:AP-1 complex subunit beta-1 isoform X1 n=2 Tax=Marmotini TaxID=337730 RepID=UPI00038BBC42|nr:AP-1 complex subunit beta-1 isoform X1 [Ictidomys tridecemlineatus]XP_026269116.1 AP-1 complex subunit beta-1 isoform X1 [Urocitellus parryii]XP_048640874.1 AP-1 complex subunit beta-1 isoform X1 [Marmota marmota marmota]XP_048640875.1 AP-1 complex subunit beta-1 isoform X1 [Marmota marmota marmota]KAG3278334.1 adaptor related protein complex 1 beta 1 subunit, transcript variant X1 [Ictidomys tridecemlineatus]
MTDSKYFTTTKKGEIFELKAELNSDKKEKKKEAVKKVIASMTVGKDVSALFPDVVNCMQTDNLELKKLVYLYLMNYAKSQPDMAIMAVNTFVKDCEDPNPLIRALAVRTMGCIRVDKITEYLCEPLRKCLKDEDPYVRKTAAVCVAKLHDINAQLVEDQGFLDTLKDLISDSNPMVVANAVAALSEIAESHPSSNLLDLNPQSINKLLTALNECTEWGQIFILDCLANYTPKDDREAQSICERVTPRLSHANSAVVLSAVKVLMKFMEMLSKDLDYYGTLLKKLAPPLVTLLSAEPELQYVALRNINLIVQKRPEILKHEMKVFFVKYNDPIYVKLEKLDIMIRLASQANIAQVLAELKEYATEVDVDFVRKAVRAIGRCAIKVEQSAERCVSTLLDLIQTKVNYVVQEAIVVIKDIFRKYPNKYESVIATLCENLDSLDEPEARAAMIWIVGEYAERIDNADELLESFLEGFHDESTQVQLQLLTAIVKLFLKKPTETQELVQQVLSLATQDSDNPDLRDRGYIYWRLLSTDPVAAKEVVLAEKPLISEETDLIEPTLLDELICYIGTLASVYHKPPSAFVEGGRGVVHKSLPPRTASSESTESPETAPAGAPAGEQPDVIPTQGDLLGDLLNLDLGPPVSGPPLATSSVQMGAVDLLGGGLDSLMGDEPEGIGDPSFGAPPAAAVPARLGAPISSGLSDLFDLTSGVGTLSGSYVAPKAVWLPAMKAKGLEISGTFTRQVGSISMDLQLTNKALQVMTDFAIQFNRNSFGLAPAAPLQVHAPLSPNQTVETSLPLNTVGSVMKMEPLNNLQVAVKNNIDVFYFSTLYPLHILFVEDGKMDRQMFLATWKDIPNENEAQFQIRDCALNAETVSSKLQSSNIFTIAKRNVEGQDMLYQSLKLTNGIWVLAELRIQPGNTSFMDLELSLKCRAPEVSQHVYQAYETILKN